jgi:hypothetical protein
LFNEVKPAGTTKHYFVPCHHAINRLTKATERVLWPQDMRDDTSGIEILVFGDRLSTFIPTKWKDFQSSAKAVGAELPSICRANYVANDAWHTQSKAYEVEYAASIDAQYA